MEGGCWPYVSIISGTACVALVLPIQAGCGLALKAEQKSPEYAQSALFAAACYLALCIGALIVTLSHSSGCRDCSFQEKEPNPIFEDATASSSLLA